MTKEQCWQTVKQAYSLIFKYFQDTDKLKTNTDISGEYRNSQLVKLESEFTSSIVNTFIMIDITY